MAQITVPFKKCCKEPDRASSPSQTPSSLFNRFRVEMHTEHGKGDCEVIITVFYESEKELCFSLDNVWNIYVTIHWPAPDTVFANDRVQKKVLRMDFFKNGESRLVEYVSSLFVSSCEKYDTVKIRAVSENFPNLKDACPRQEATAFFAPPARHFRVNVSLKRYDGDIQSFSFHETQWQRCFSLDWAKKLQVVLSYSKRSDERMKYTRKGVKVELFKHKECRKVLYLETSDEYDCNNYDFARITAVSSKDYPIEETK